MLNSGKRLVIGRFECDRVILTGHRVDVLVSVCNRNSLMVPITPYLSILNLFSLEAQLIKSLR